MESSMSLRYDNDTIKCFEVSTVAGFLVRYRSGSSILLRIDEQRWCSLDRGLGGERKNYAYTLVICVHDRGT